MEAAEEASFSAATVAISKSSMLPSSTATTPAMDEDLSRFIL